MDKRVQSGLFFDGSAMRYAEVEHGSSALRLHRLGSCDFEFDAEHAVYRGGREQVNTIQEALLDVFSGTACRYFTVVVPAAECVAFYSPLSSTLSDDEAKNHLEGEARLVTGTDEPLALTSDAVASEDPDGEEVVWHHVAAMPQAKWDRLADVLGVFEESQFRYLTRMQAASRIARQSKAADAETVQLLVGRDDGSTELGLVVGRRLRSSEVAAVTDPADVCYHALAEIKRSGISLRKVSQVLLYGDEDKDLETELAKLVSPSVARMDPLEIIANAPADIKFDPGQYVLSIGGAL
ncbi:MAG: hypothetical protein KJO98_12630 [Rhodothermia bacterium]|nr:hypothetical protein [Rhodothermia bacterium]